MKQNMLRASQMKIDILKRYPVCPNVYKGVVCGRPNSLRTSFAYLTKREGLCWNTMEVFPKLTLHCERCGDGFTWEFPPKDIVGLEITDRRWNDGDCTQVGDWEITF